jgi:signal transduction histidine kinase
MVSVVRELLDVARLQMGQPLELDRRPADLVAIVRRELELRRDAGFQGDIRVECDVESLIGTWDEARLERVVTNLVGNAVKYGADREVVLSLSTEPGGSPGSPDWAVLRVRDRGQGIAAEDLPHVFERFYRGRNVAGRVEGLGLGLATVRHIVEQHGGTVSVSSEPQRGTTFVVRLPLSSPGPAEQPAG